jgi:hypothetical protein
MLVVQLLGNKIKDADAFLKEIDQIRWNAESFNGTNHPIAVRGREMYQEACLKLETLAAQPEAPFQPSAPLVRQDLAVGPSRKRKESSSAWSADPWPGEAPSSASKARRPKTPLVSFSGYGSASVERPMLPPSPAIPRYEDSDFSVGGLPTWDATASSSASASVTAAHRVAPMSLRIVMPSKSATATPSLMRGASDDFEESGRHLPDDRQ